MWWAGFVCFAWVIGRYSVFSPVFVLLLSFCLLFFVESRGFGGFWGGYCGVFGSFSRAFCDFGEFDGRLVHILCAFMFISGLRGLLEGLNGLLLCFRALWWVFGGFWSIDRGCFDRR